MEKITEFDELNKLLGKNFIILCGSAISSRSVMDERGKAKPFLPMVQDVTQAIFSSFAKIDNNESPINDIYSKYSTELSSGIYEDTRKQIKFEEFLWKLENVLDDKNKVALLLNNFFYCNDSQFDINHSVIAYLLKSKRITTCLTTNFDNAIENAFGKTNLSTISYPNIPNIFQQKDHPTLIKLHGDVVRNSYNATIPDLLEAEKQKIYQFLQDCFTQNTILVAGYSGYGDIDISPHLDSLSTLGANLIWIVRDTVSAPHPSAKFYFQSNLHSVNPEENILLKLAVVDGYKAPTKIQSPNWQKNFQSWVDEITSDQKREIILETFNRTHGWPYFHLYQLKRWFSLRKKKNERKLDQYNFAVKCIQRGVYLSGLHYLKSAYPSKNDVHFQADWNYWLGFSTWRSDSSYKAANIFNYFVTNFDSEISKDLLARGIRLYLNASQDILRCTKSLRKRKELFDVLDLENAISKLDLLEINDYRNEIQKRLSINAIGHLIGSEYDFEQTKRLFERCMNLHDWAIAQQVAKIMTHMNFKEGMDAIEKVDEKVIFRIDFKYLRKNVVEILDAKYDLPIKICLLFENKLFRRAKALRVELFFQIRRLKWFIPYRLGIPIIERNLPNRKKEKTFSIKLYKYLFGKLKAN